MSNLRLKVGKDFFSAKNIAVFGILLAISIVLQIFGGAIQIGIASLNFALIPMVLAALFFGAWGGALIGAVNGIVIFLTACVFAPGGLFPFMFAANPVMMFLICFFKTTAAGFISGLLFDILLAKNKYVAVFVASGIAPVVNTALFVFGMFLLQGDIVAFMGEGSNIFNFIFITLVGFNFFFELAVNLLVAPGLHTVYNVLEKEVIKKISKK